MSSRDLTRPLLRAMYVEGVPDEVVLVCPYTPLDRVARGVWAVELPECIGSEVAGLCAQLLASGVEKVHIADTCTDRPDVASARQALYDLFPDVTPWEPPRRRFGTRKPEVLQLGHIPLPRRMVLGFISVPEGALVLGRSEHQRQLDALEILRDAGRLNEQVGSQTEEVTSLARELTVRGCTACGVCVLSCPLGALSLPVSGGSASLVYNPTLCEGVLQCVQLCPEGAMVDGAPIPLTDLAGVQAITLAQVPVAQCARCRAYHHEADEEYCLGCRRLVTGGFGTVGDIDALIERAQKHRQALFGDEAP